MGEVDLTLHVDPTTGKPAGEVKISEEITKSGVELEAEVEVDENGQPRVSVGIKIPF